MRTDKDIDTENKTLDLPFKLILPYRSSYKEDSQFYNANPTTNISVNRDTK